AGLGCVLSAFLLIELFGFQTTLLLTAGLNVLCFVIAFALSTRQLPGGKKAARKKPEPAESGSDRPVLALLGLTGFTSMAMEIVWTREFTPYLGNFVYTFAVILAA